MYVQNKYYQILESSRYDDIETIRRNYKRIIFIHHPDRGGDENFAKEVNIAWNVIKENHVQQERQSDNRKTNSSTKGKHTTNSNKTKNTKNKYKNSSKNNKKNTKKDYDKNNGRCSRCNSKYESYDVYCTQCGHKINRKKNKSNNSEDIELFCIGVILIGLGLLFLSLCWPLGIIYFYLLYKYLFD